MFSLEDQIEFLKSDLVMLLPHFNKNLEAFREELDKYLNERLCPPEIREKCIQDFLEIKKVINGHLTEES